MDLHLTLWLKLRKRKNRPLVSFKEMGVFDPILDIDSKLFIDPHLLKFTQAPELNNSYSKIRRRFQDVLRVMKQSEEKNDLFWRRANGLLSFSEISGFCIGYSAKGTSGSGIGGKLREQLLEVSKQIIDAGITDPEIFELVGLFEDNIGADRISDMTAQIIADDIFLYTERIFKDLKLPTSDYGFRGNVYKLGMNPYAKFPIILIPQDILRDLPIAECWDDIDVVCKYNEQLRQRVNHIIGDTWKKAVGTKKSVLKKVLLKEPEVLKDLITLYKNKPAQQYDFYNDPAGQVAWYSVSKICTKENPLELMLPRCPAASDVLNVVLKICDKFKDLIENNALCSLLYTTQGKPKREEACPVPRLMDSTNKW